MTSPASPTSLTFSAGSALSPPPDPANSTESNESSTVETRPRAGTAATVRTMDPISEHGTRPSMSSAGFRLRRTGTLKPSQDYQIEAAGMEPGIDPESHSITDERIQSLHTKCQITIVEFSEDELRKTELWNDELKDFLAAPRPEWAKVRWINCNGLNWDVIQQLARHYKLHSLALEDILSNHDNNRPKCDWYSDHAFVILPLLKLLDNHSDDDSDSESFHHPPFWRRIFPDILNRKEFKSIDPEIRKRQETGDRRNVVRTLQQAFGGPNVERTAYMESHSCLVPLQKIVHVEQVSAFLTADGTVITFFEISGDDIESENPIIPPILSRLYSKKTLLRTSSDPSMMLQAIIDAIVDLAFPVIGAYQDTIAELELSVLTDPSIRQSQDLYILTSELSLLKSTLAPTAAVVTSLRDHKRGVGPKIKGSGVEVSDMTRIYLGDVLDHVLLILDNLETMKRAADNMIDLIFNTIGSLQNESMKQLTTITIVFLPITFLAGYFGMNFEDFPSIKKSDAFFWQVSAPVIFITLMFCLRQIVGRGVYKKFERRAIKVAGDRRRKRLKQA